MTGYPHIDDARLGEIRAGVVAGRMPHRADVVYLIDEVLRLRHLATVPYPASVTECTCEVGSCGKHPERHAPICRGCGLECHPRDEGLCGFCRVPDSPGLSGRCPTCEGHKTIRDPASTNTRLHELVDCPTCVSGKSNVSGGGDA